MGSFTSKEEISYKPRGKCLDIGGSIPDIGGIGVRIYFLVSWV